VGSCIIRWGGGGGGGGGGGEICDVKGSRIQ